MFGVLRGYIDGIGCADLNPAAGIGWCDLNCQRFRFDGGLGDCAGVCGGQLEREEIFLRFPSYGDDKENQQQENQINHRRDSQSYGRSA